MRVAQVVAQGQLAVSLGRVDVYQVSGAGVHSMQVTSGSHLPKNGTRNVIHKLDANNMRQTQQQMHCIQ